MNKRFCSILLSMCLFISCAPSESTNSSITNNNNLNLAKEQFFFLSSILSLNILDDYADKSAVYSAVKARVEELESKFSINLDESEVSMINKNASVHPVKVSDDTYSVIKNALLYSDISNGKFDISVGNLVKLWGIGSYDEHIPNEDEISFSLKTIDYTKIILNDDDKSVFLQDSNMMIDLGGIAKGYVADEIVNILKEHNVKSAIINLGGNVYVHGDKNGEDFKIGVRDPFSSDPAAYFGIYKTSDESIVTSGVYERFFEKDEIIYHHILSTDTGYPVNNELMSSTIFCKNSMIADALSTSTFALGLKDALTLIESLDNVEAIFVTKDKDVYLSSGIGNKFSISSDEYSLAN